MWSALKRVLYRLRRLHSAYHFLWPFLGAFLFHSHSKQLKVIGVTGTKGKTTSLELLSEIFRAAGKKTALLSSLKIQIGEHTEKNTTGNSMPGRTFLQRFLSKAARDSAEYALIEVTSQGVVLHRHRFIRWAAAVLTNLAPEHIEAHGSFENYRAAKLKFLKYAARQGAPVFLNQQDSGSEFFFNNLPAENIRFFNHSMIPELPGEVFEILRGDFSKDNIASAVAVAEYFKIPREAIVAGLKNFKGAQGRLEFVQKKPFAVVVDYAHTPDSLQAIYGALKPPFPQRLICVLGAAGGGRDKWKRPIMGKVAGDYCDLIILTDEDPYDENPKEILNEIEKGILQEKTVQKILDRKEAIQTAIRQAVKGDTVVLTGKGSEDWIHLARGKRTAWNERQAAEEALKAVHGA